MKKEKLLAEMRNSWKYEITKKRLENISFKQLFGDNLIVEYVGKIKFHHLILFSF